MNEEKAIVAIAMFVCTAAVFAIKFISAAVLKYQENELRAKSGPVSDGRLERIEHALDSIAVEVERITENQRFVTKVLSENSSASEKSPSTKPGGAKRLPAEN
jgi:hypothetical protein